MDDLRFLACFVFFGSCFTSAFDCNTEKVHSQRPFLRKSEAFSHKRGARHEAPLRTFLFPKQLSLRKNVVIHKASHSNGSGLTIEGECALQLVSVAVCATLCLYDCIELLAIEKAHHGTRKNGEQTLTKRARESQRAEPWHRTCGM